jgi:hypothetical protein
MGGRVAMKKDKLITDKNEATDAVMSFVKFRIAPTVGVITLVFTPIDEDTGKQLDEFQQAVVAASTEDNMPKGFTAGMAIQLGVPKGMPPEAVVYMLQLVLEDMQKRFSNQEEE